MANIAKEYATKRYRSNLINWGMIPFVYDDKISFEANDIIVIKDINDIFENYEIKAYVCRKGKTLPVSLKLDKLSDEEKLII